jgi:hypothetical protein
MADHKTNIKVRSDIIEVLFDNSKDIPDGVYLKVCNLLQNFRFFPHNDLELDDFEHDMIVIRRYEIAEAERQETQRREQRRERRRYVTNPETGRRVLRDGRIGRSIARQNE